MKTREASFFAGAMLLISTFQLPADGVVNFNNVGALSEDKIYRGNWLWTGTEIVMVTWVPCNGPNFHASLHWGPAGATDDSQFQQLGATVSFLSGGFAGTFSGGNRLISTPETGPVLSFQVRAWEGPYDSWSQALYSGSPSGKGPIFELKTKDPSNVFETMPLIYRTEGYRGFIFSSDGVTVILVPEPSTYALGALGLVGLWVTRRRNKGKS
jgi:hypothetical protein